MLRILTCIVLIIPLISSTTVHPGCPGRCTCFKSIAECNSLDIDYFGFDIYKLKLINIPEPVTLTDGIFKTLGLENISFLQIDNVTVYSIHPNAFAGLKELNQLSITNSRIPPLVIDTTPFSLNLRKLILSGSTLKDFKNLKLPALEELDLSNCNLSEIHQDAFANMPELSYINLSNNQLSTFDSNIFLKLESLVELQLANNKFTKIPEEIFSNNTDLSTLNLSNNPLKKFEVRNPSNLEDLILNSCELTEFTGGENLEFLGKLDLSNNSLSVLPVETFYKMSELENLDLSNNKLIMLDENLFLNNMRLLKIVLDNNALIALPKFKSKGKTFQTFYFSCNNCQLESINEQVFDSFPGLVTLKLSNNNLMDIAEKTFQKLHALIELDLSFNQLSEFNANTFKENYALQNVNLAGNLFTYLDSDWFSMNLVLATLDVSKCRLSELWKKPAKKLNSLSSLILSRNNLTDIRVEDLEVTKSLKVLDIKYNPLSCTNELRDTIKWLTMRDVATTVEAKKTHDSLDVEEFDVTASTSWEEVARDACTDYDEYFDKWDDNDSNYGDDDIVKIKITNKMDGETDKKIDGNYIDDKELAEKEVYEKDLDEDNYDIDDIESFMKDSKVLQYLAPGEVIDDDDEDTPRYSYLWPTVMFLLTSVAVLIVAANVILLILKKRSNGGSNITLSHIQILPWVTGSNIKKHSGSVYRPLSEETSTPRLSLFRYQHLNTNPGVHKV